MVVVVVRMLPIGFVEIHRDEFGAGIGHRSVNRQSMKTLTLCSLFDSRDLVNDRSNPKWDRTLTLTNTGDRNDDARDRMKP